MHVIGAGLGRTGTNALKLAIEHLGLGPCHHMEEVPDHPEQVLLWSAALGGSPDWDAIYRGYARAVDWPTVAFFQDLASVYPSAKFVLTLRGPDSWAESFSKTVYKLVAERQHAPADTASTAHDRRSRSQDRLPGGPRCGSVGARVRRP